MLSRKAERLWKNAYAAAAKRVQKSGTTQNTLENNSKEGYNEDIKHALKNWRTDLNKTQLKEVEKRLRQAGNPEETRITDTANWYKGRINGDDLFVIYSIEDANNPTILYEVKGKNAKVELDILMDLLEGEENGESTNGKPSFAQRVSKGNWVQNVNSSQGNLRHMGNGRNNQNAGVLQGQSQRNGSRAFRNVLENLFEIQERDGELNEGKRHSLKDSGTKSVAKTEQYTENEYRNFGWARANNILNEGQNADYRSKFADAKVGRAKFNKSKKGEYIIPVSDIYDSSTEGVNNVLVFAKGTITNPVITSVIEIYEYDETNLDRVRRQIYDGERRGIQQEAGELFGRYHASDFEFQPNQQRIGSESVGNSSDNGYGERSRGEASSIKGETRVKKSLKGTDSLVKDYEKLKNGKISSEEYEQLLERYGSISPGEKPYREARVPKKTADGRKVSQTVRTILEAKATPDEAIPSIEKMVTDGDFSYDTYTDKQAISDANAIQKAERFRSAFFVAFCRQIL